MRILLIEDEFILATDLTEILEEEGYQVSGVFDNGPEAYIYFQNNEVDLILCDINIKGNWDGIETIKKCISLRQTPVIYLTALTDKETLNRAKETFPAAYISKPFNRQNLQIAIEMAINNFDSISHSIVPGSGPKKKEGLLQINNNIFIKQGYHFIKFKASDILYLKSDNLHTDIYADKKYSIRQSLSSTLDNLQMKSLVRVHRSFAVNLDKIDRFNENEIHLEGNTIPIGRSYKESFMTNFNLK